MSQANATSHPARTAQVPRVLVVDDDRSVLQLLERLLEKRYAVQAFADPAQALEYLRRHPVDVVITDYLMPGMNGVEFLRRSLEILPEARRVVITGYYDLSAIVASINEARIDFFLTKPIHAAEVYQAVERLWRDRLLQIERDHLAEQNAHMVEELQRFNTALEATVRERTEELMRANAQLKQALEEIEEKNRALTLLNESLNVLATVDPLTDLYNRREFLHRLSLEWDRFKRYGRPFSLIMLDIDHFKRVNDTHGHECGDVVLRELGRLMREQKRRHDLVCRYGGEEFVIILPETQLDDAFIVAEKLRNQVAGHKFACKEIPLQVRVSLGAASAPEHEAADEEQLIKIADQSLYRAKHEGRNCTVILERLDGERIARRSEATA